MNVGGNVNYNGPTNVSNTNITNSMMAGGAPPPSPPPVPIPDYNPGYAPQQLPQPYYPPAPQPYPAAPPQPYIAAPPPAPIAPVAQQQTNTNVVVVGQQAPQQTTIIQRPKEKVNHVLHLLITLFLFPPWMFVWMILCCIYGC